MFRWTMLAECMNFKAFAKLQNISITMSSSILLILSIIEMTAEELSDLYYYTGSIIKLKSVS